MIIPLATTIWLTITIATWVIRFLTRFPNQLNPFTGLHPILIYMLNLLVGFAVPLFSILLIGLMARNIVGRWLLDFGERVLQSIPLAGAVYVTLQQILQTLLRDSKSRFRRVILVEYPRRGLWAIAFVTGSLTAQPQLPENTNPENGNKMLSVFIPTTPNPTSGWYAVVPETDVVNLSISIEDAFKVLLSGGIVGPNLAAALRSQQALAEESETQADPGEQQQPTVVEEVELPSAPAMAAQSSEQEDAPLHPTPVGVTQPPAEENSAPQPTPDVPTQPLVAEESENQSPPVILNPQSTAVDASETQPPVILKHQPTAVDTSETQPPPVILNHQPVAE